MSCSKRRGDGEITSRSKIENEAGYRVRCPASSVCKLRDQAIVTCSSR